MNAPKLTPLEARIVELFRTRCSDAHMRETLGMTQNALIRAVFGIRCKLMVGPSETVREAADRLGLPREVRS